MKIALAAPTYLPARRANTIQVLKMAQALAQAGHFVRVAVPGIPTGGARPSWGELAHIYGLRQPFDIEWLPAHARLRRYDFGIRAVHWARSWGAEILYTRLLQAAACASLMGMPVILEVHDRPQGRLGPLAFRLFLKGRGARRLVAITRALAADLTSLGAPQSPPFTIIASDGVDLERYENLPDISKARQRLVKDGQGQGGIHLDGFVAGYTGHLYAGRGGELLINLAASLPQITFLIAGGEHEHVEQVRRQVEQRGLQNVILTGFVANADLPLYQAACNVLLLPYGQKVAASSGGDISRYFSPMKLFEYLACGRAILCTDFPVLREVLNDSNAILLPPDDVKTWSEALCNLIEFPEKTARLGEQAHRDAQQYSWERRVEKILDGIEVSNERFFSF